MKQLSIIGIVMVLCMAISSCSSDPQNEPNNPDENTNDDGNTALNDYRDNWYVVYRETSYQNPSWTKQENNSEECNDWKWAHRDFLVYDIQEGGRHEWEWHVTYKNHLKSFVEEEARKFVKWTLDSHEVSPVGLDLYTATVQSSQSSHITSFSYSLYDDQPNNPNRWLIRYTENRYEKFGERLDISSEFLKWSSEHEKYLTAHTENNGSYGVYSRNTWEIESTTINLSDAVASLDKFRSWSINKIYSEDDAYLELGGSVLDRKSGVTSSY